MANYAGTFIRIMIHHSDSNGIANFCMQTSEAERIGVNQVAKVLPSGKASGTEQCTPLLCKAPLPHACASAHDA